MAAVVPESTSARALEGRARTTERAFSIGIAPMSLGIVAFIVGLDNRAFWSALLHATAADGQAEHLWRRRSIRTTTFA